MLLLLLLLLPALTLLRVRARAFSCVPLRAFGLSVTTLPPSLPPCIPFLPRCARVHVRAADQSPMPRAASVPLARNARVSVRARARERARTHPTCV
jgi:hypothetical protein